MTHGKEREAGVPPPAKRTCEDPIWSMEGAEYPKKMLAYREIEQWVPNYGQNMPKALMMICGGVTSDNNMDFKLGGSNFASFCHKK